MKRTIIAAAALGLSAASACSAPGHPVNRVKPSTPAVSRVTDPDGDLIIRVGGVYYQASHVGQRWIVGSDAGPLPECRTEDSTNCVWNAALSGNHRGRSFFTTPGGTVVYL